MLICDGLSSTATVHLSTCFVFVSLYIVQSPLLVFLRQAVTYLQYCTFLIPRILLLKLLVIKGRIHSKILSILKLSPFCLSVYLCCSPFQ